MKSPMKRPTPATKKRETPAKTPAKAPMPGPAMPMHDPDMMKHRAQDALHTLRRADEIKADPALMAHVKKHAMEQRDHLNKVIRRTK